MRRGDNYLDTCRNGLLLIEVFSKLKTQPPGTDPWWLFIGLQGIQDYPQTVTQIIRNILTQLIRQVIVDDTGKNLCLTLFTPAGISDQYLKQKGDFNVDCNEA